MARVISVCNQKGGVGKTTTAVNAAAYLAALGRRALLIDFDPQANASSALGHDPLKTAVSVYHGILDQVEIDRIRHKTAVERLHIIPAAPHLAGALIELVNQPEREYFLRKFVNRIRHHYDYILIDLPPSLSLLTINGLLASDEIVIPVQAEYYSLEGLGQLLETVELIKQNLGHRLTVAGALLTMYDERERLARDVAKDLRTHFPHRVFDMEIPRHGALAEAPSFSQPIALYRPDSPGARAYRKLAEALMVQEAKVLPPGFGNFNLQLS